MTSQHSNEREASLCKWGPLFDSAAVTQLKCLGKMSPIITRVSKRLFKKSMQMSHQMDIKKNASITSNHLIIFHGIWWDFLDGETLFAHIPTLAQHTFIIMTSNYNNRQHFGQGVEFRRATRAKHICIPGQHMQMRALLKSLGNLKTKHTCVMAGDGEPMARELSPHWPPCGTRPRPAFGSHVGDPLVAATVDSAAANCDRVEHLSVNPPVATRFLDYPHYLRCVRKGQGYRRRYG